MRANGFEAPARRREALYKGFSKAAREGEAGGAQHASPAAVDNKVRPPGAERSKPINTACGTPGKPALRNHLCTFFYLLCTDLRGRTDPGVPRALVYRAQKGMRFGNAACPGPIKQYGR